MLFIYANHGHLAAFALDFSRCTRPDPMNAESKDSYPRLPIGKALHKVRISAEEMSIAHRHRQLTGEPIQTWIRRLIREQSETYDTGEKP